MELMKLLIELGTQLQKAAEDKETLKERIGEVDQAVAQILGEIQKTTANAAHIKYVP
jgi:hypothetical protein